MKKRFSNIALVLVAVAAIAFTGCKDNNPKIEGQWVVVGDSKLYDISTTKPGYLIIGNSNSYLSEKHKLSADHYFYSESDPGSIAPIQIRKTSNTSGEIIPSSYLMGKMTYTDLKKNSVRLKLFYFSGDIKITIELIKVSSKLIPVDVDKLEK